MRCTYCGLCRSAPSARRQSHLRTAIASFLDTNVVVCAYDRDEAEKREVARAALSSDPGSLVVSTQVLAEFFWVATRKLARPIADDRAAQVVARLARFRVVGADSRLVLTAIDLARDRQLSLWDALIVRAAQVGRCDRLLTEDLQDGAVFDGLVIENPFL